MKRMMIPVLLSVLFFVHATTADAAAAQAAGTSRPAAQTPARPAGAAPAAPATAPKAGAPLPFPADAKIAFVNMQLIVNDSKLGKLGQDKLKALTDKRTSDVTTKNTAIQQKQQELQQGQNVLTPAVLAQKQAELESMQRELQFLQQQAQTELQNLNEQLLGEFSDKVLPIIEQIRAEKNLLVVFQSGEGSNVAALNPAIDLSTEVVKRLDAGQ